MAASGESGNDADNICQFVHADDGSRPLTKAANPQLQMMVQVADLMAPAIKADTEIVVHDLRELDRSVARIVNGHVTGRTAGHSIITAPRKLAGLKEILKSTAEPLSIQRVEMPDMPINGRTIRSCSLIAYDDVGRPAAALCLNADLTLQDDLLKSFQAMFGGPSGGAAPTLESRETSMDELVEEIIQSALTPVAARRGKPTREQIKAALGAMHARGLFQIRGSVEMVAARLKLSKFTIYKYFQELEIE